MSSRYLCEKEAAAYLGISRSTIQRWRKRRVGPKYFRFGRVLRYSVRALEAFARKHTKTAA